MSSRDTEPALPAGASSRVEPAPRPDAGRLAPDAARPPKALKPLKARHAGECERLEQLPNIGPSIAGDLRRIGVAVPADLQARDPFELYRALCQATGKRQDPCVLDTFIAAVDFVGGAEPRPWWHYTAERKQRYGTV